MSNGAMDLLEKMLIFDPSKRITGEHLYPLCFFMALFMFNKMNDVLV
jgi:hypothetical protein